MEIINQNVEKFNTALRVDNKGLFSCLEIDVEKDYLSRVLSLLIPLFPFLVLK